MKIACCFCIRELLLSLKAFHLTFTVLNCLNCTNYYAAFLKSSIPKEDGSLLSAAVKESQLPWKAVVKCSLLLFFAANIREEIKE